MAIHRMALLADCGDSAPSVLFLFLFTLSPVELESLPCKVATKVVLSFTLCAQTFIECALFVFYVKKKYTNKRKTLVSCACYRIIDSLRKIACIVQVQGHARHNSVGTCANLNIIPE